MTTLRRLTLSLTASLGGLALLPPTAAAQSVKPAGGAALDQVAIASGAGIVLAVALAWLGIGHRSGKVPWLGRWARWSSRISGLPPWAALPTGVAAVSLITAVFGMYWDISLHIDVGRDPGPLANPAHYFILAGLAGIFTAGCFAVVLPGERPGPTAIWVSRDWYAPLGGVLMCACSAFSLIGFPLDDVWHRLFGQDVTLWGPTHLMLIGGAAMALLGIGTLLIEGTRATRAADPDSSEMRWVRALRPVSLAGALLVGLCTFQAEFDFGVPQFRLVFAPMLIMLAAGVGLTAARLWLGRGSALAAVGFFLLIRGGVAILVGPILGNPTPHFPLFVTEALIVEVLAVVVPRDRPLRFALLSGLGIGTIGLAAEWGWSHVWSPIPWPSALLGSGVPMGLGMAMGAALIGTWVGTRLGSDGVHRPAALRPAAVTGAVVVAALVIAGLYRTDPTNTSARLTVTPVLGGAHPTANVDVRLNPPAAADHAHWLTATAWQGGGLVVHPLRRVAEGRYETTSTVPVYGNWKTIIRLASGTTLAALPVYMPADRAIPLGAIPALASVSRSFVADHKLLQRESQISGGVISLLAYGVVAVLALALLALLAWGLHRLGVPADDAAATTSIPRRTADREAGLGPAVVAPPRASVG